MQSDINKSLNISTIIYFVNIFSFHFSILQKRFSLALVAYTLIFFYNQGSINNNLMTVFATPTLETKNFRIYQ